MIGTEKAPESHSLEKTTFILATLPKSDANQPSFEIFHSTMTLTSSLREC